MPRPARTTVRHGMASCARYGCKRTECRSANVRASNDSHRRVKQGIRATVDATDARDHARTLVTAGMPAAVIAAKAGVAPTTVTNLIAGRRQTLYRDTRDAILGVKAPAKVVHFQADGLVSAVAARRRLQALTALGHTLPVLSRETGVSAETISSIRNGRRQQLRISLNRSIAAAYERLWKADPLECGASRSGSSRARLYARQHAWAPPAAWDDERIHDPKARPKGLIRYAALREGAAA